MASQKVIAITNEQSQDRLRQNIPVLAQRFDVDAPDLNIPLRYSLDYRRAVELERISKFIETLNEQEPTPEPNNAQVKLDAIVAMVSQPMTQWTKQELVDLVLGGAS
jgi:hypothetical protein